MNLRGYASATDPGRKRRQNEDSYVAEPPIFAIADGMGGAQAGEIASRLAAAALKESVDAESDEERVAELIQEANRRVYRQSNEDAAMSGMGTTMTVALVGDASITIGHVGDSRAYRIRSGRLEQLTHDHSLVAELVRSGKLSPEEAETHPQRSVITRAVGTDPDVDVDTFTIEPEEGDLFLICSDGLTDMVDDETILAAVEGNRGNLKRATKALVDSANRNGGEDNITVVAFEVGDDLGRTKPMPAVEERNGGSPDDDEDTLTGLAVTPELEEAGARHREDEWIVDDEELEHEDAAPAPSPRSRRRRRRAPVLGLAALVLLAAIAGLALWGFASAHFVGARSDGRVAVYQGVPWNLAGGVHLYREVYVSPLYAAQLTQAERRRLFDHSLVSEGDARSTLRPYEAEASP